MDDVAHDLDNKVNAFLKSAPKRSKLTAAMSEYEDKVIIKGLTRDGERFRPSDWAQRLVNSVSSIGPNNRIIYHPSVQIAVVDGVSAVLVDQSMCQSDPRLMRFMIRFAASNELLIENLPKGALGRL